VETDKADQFRVATNKHHNSFLQTNDDLESEKEREQYLDSTTKYLKNCMKEIQYLLTPPQHPPPPQILPNGNYTGLPEPPLSVEEYYARQQQQQLHPNAHGYSQPTAAPNHLPPPVPNNLPQAYNHQDPMQTRGQQHQGYPETQQPLPEPQQQVTQPEAALDVPVVSVTHTFDSYGNPIQDQAAQRTGVPQTKQQTDPDGWTFEEEPQLQTENSQASVSPRRPDTDLFPSAANSSQLPAKSPPRTGMASHRRKSSGSTSMSRRRSSQGKTDVHDGLGQGQNADPTQFKVKFALRGHLDVVRSVIFSGGGSPGEPEVCTAGDDGTIKRWIIPASYQNFNATTSSPDLDVQAIFTHRGHEGMVTSLASCSASGFNTGGRASGDGWIFSGGQDATIRVWERGRVDPKETLQGHTDAVWSVCILPTTVGDVFGSQSNNFGGPERLLLVSGSADGTVKVWAVSAPPQSSSPSTGSRRGVGGSRRHSVTSGSNFPSSPQPSVASTTPFTYTLVHSIERPTTGDGKASPTSIAPLSATGENFVVSYTDSSVLIFDTKSGEEIIGMASNETYDGTMGTSINTVVATSMGLEGAGPGLLEASRGIESEEVGAGATGSREGVEGVVITGHEDRFVRFFDANSGKLQLISYMVTGLLLTYSTGQCTYTMLAHPSAISALCLSKDGREAVSAGHDASIRFWSLEKRICTQDIVSHRAMRGEGVCDVCWSSDGRLVVSAGGDGVVKVFAR
jgi:striatin 1/3/4